MFPAEINVRLFAQPSIWFPQNSQKTLNTFILNPLKLALETPITQFDCRACEASANLKQHKKTNLKIRNESS
jgi:hypothetical protein